jgi:hypothetical protein
VPLAGNGLASRSQETGIKNSLYLDRPLFPLAVALPRMLEKIGAELPMAGPAEARRLCQRAQLILDLFTPKSQSPVPT